MLCLAERCMASLIISQTNPRLASPWYAPQCHAGPSSTSLRFAKPIIATPCTALPNEQTNPCLAVPCRAPPIRALHGRANSNFTSNFTNKILASHCRAVLCFAQPRFAPHCQAEPCLAGPCSALLGKFTNKSLPCQAPHSSAMLYLAIHCDAKPCLATLSHALLSRTLPLIVNSQTNPCLAVPFDALLRIA